jgi:predicted lipid-binding transport protein (Tim44 family)/tellurite resistance protein
VALLGAPALATIGGGEHFDSGRSSSDSGGGDGGFLIDLLVWLIIRHPKVGIPLAIIVAIVWFVVKRNTDGDASTRKALDRAEAASRTQVSAAAVQGWVAALQAKDPQFQLLPFFDGVKQRYLELQEAWFRRDMDPVRRYLSDAMYRRLTVQLRILHSLGVRDATADIQVIDLALIGLTQTDAYDSVHVRVTAQLRDDDAPADFTDEQARAKAMKKAPDRLMEVWTFVRRPGATTKPEAGLAQGKCPNCGAPFEGGASNTCEFCGAIVNSGAYDWVLSEITQASVYSPSHEAAEGVAAIRQSDPAFATEVLEDRASLVFWKWIEAQVLSKPANLAKLATADFSARVQADVEALAAQGQRRLYAQCAVGAVDTLRVSREGEREVAAVAVRWSAQVGVAPKTGPAGQLNRQPSRSVLLLERKAGATSSDKAGMSTERCPACAAPLSDNGQPTCEYCGTQLASGERDWVLSAMHSWEWWVARAGAKAQHQPRHVGARVPDRDERERLVYLMAAMAKADGVVDDRERRLLRMASERWGVPWGNVELALNAGDGLFQRLVTKGSIEAEAFFRELLAVAMADGRIDKKERRLLETAATHLGVDKRLIDEAGR